MIKVLGVIVLVYNTELSVAIRYDNGDYYKVDTSIFELAGIINYMDSLSISINKYREMTIQVKCPVCGDVHSHTYSIADVLKRKMSIFGCELTGLPICIVGKSDKVTRFIDKQKEINEKLYAML